MGLFLLGILPCYTPLQPAAPQAWLTGQHTDVRGRATNPRLVALPPFEKPVCDMSNGELRKALSDFGVDRIDRIKFWFTRLTGKQFLATSKHELIQAGISLQGAGHMEELVEAVMTKGAPPSPCPPARTMLPRPRPRVMSPPAVIIVEGKTFTLSNPQKFDSMLRTAGALGLKELWEKGDPSARLCNDLGMLTSGSEYIYAYAETGSKWAKLEGGLTTHQGTLDRITELCERDVSHGTPPINPRASATLNVLSCPWSQAAAALETQLEEKYGASVVFKLEKAMLTAPARKPASGVQTNKKPQGSVPDGAFLVKVDDAQIVYVLEAKFDGDVRSSALPPQTSICRAPSRAF